MNDTVRRIIRAYDDPIIRLYCWGRFGILRQRFLDEIGFGLERKQEALRRYVGDHHWFKEESWEDEVVSIERVLSRRP